MGYHSRAWHLTFHTRPSRDRPSRGGGGFTLSVSSVLRFSQFHTFRLTGCSHPSPPFLIVPSSYSPFHIPHLTLAQPSLGQGGVSRLTKQSVHVSSLWASFGRVLARSTLPTTLPKGWPFRPSSPSLTLLGSFSRAGLCRVRRRVTLSLVVFSFSSSAERRGELNQEFLPFSLEFLKRRIEPGVLAFLVGVSEVRPKRSEVW